MLSSQVLVLHGSDVVHSWVLPPSEQVPPEHTLIVTNVLPSQWACSQMEPEFVLVEHAAVGRQTSSVQLLSSSQCRLLPPQHRGLVPSSLQQNPLAQ